MEQRLLRLGDIVDDYCPRERRITNHAIVAIVEDAIRQTRCTTCDSEHVYKHAREPLRRRKDDAVLVGPPTPVGVAAAETAEAVPSAPTTDVEAAVEPEIEAALSAAHPDSASSTDDRSEPHHEDGWLAHRRLIRASLPKVEGEPQAPRPIPEFTMHQRPVGRGGNAFRFARGGHGYGSGNGPRRGDGSQVRGQHGDQNGNREGGNGGRRQGRGHGKRSR